MENPEENEDIKLSEFFSNFNYGPLAICTSEAPKEYHYQNLIKEGFVPLSYVERSNMDMDDPNMVGILEQVPDTTGVLICMSFFNNYY